MSIKRINSTGRKKIVRDDVHISVKSGGDGKLSYEATVDLNGYELPGDAHVFIEAYRQTTFMRFPHGTVAEPASPPYEARQLTEFAERDGLLFRVKVSANHEREGMLLAEADQVPISDDDEHPDRRVALLPPLPKDLGDELWVVEFEGPNGAPQLAVNKRVGDWKALASSPAFRSLVYPAAMRSVLWRIYRDDVDMDPENAADWRGRWISFASKLPGSFDPPNSKDEDDWREWIDTAAKAFAKQHSMLALFRAAMLEDSQ